uniref:Uncharacterized protein n=1 Tax=Fagus sylvatica TaxID=28930 RepID=A0A2N9FTZ5_FAGSY
MLHSYSYSHHFLTPNFNFPIYNKSSLLLSSPLINFPYKPTTLHHVSALPKPRPESWLAQVPEPTAPEEGPIELPLSSPSIFATTDDPSPIQIATSVLLTGAVSVFLFRSLRRRARRAKELQFRSTGVKKSLKEEAVDTLKAMGSNSIEANTPPSPVQALLGGLSAGVIAFILYKFTLTIEAALNRQTISDNFSYTLAPEYTLDYNFPVAYYSLDRGPPDNHNHKVDLTTFFHHSAYLDVSLTINSFMEDSANEENKSKGDEQLDSLNSTVESATDTTEVSSSKGDQSSNDTQ